MSLDAGSVYTILGGKFAGSGFERFDAANKKAVASAEAAEGRISAASGRVAKAQDRVASSAGKAAESGRRLSEAIPLRAMDQWDKSSGKAADNLGKLGTVAAKGAGIGILTLGAGLVYAATKATTFNREMLKISTQAGASTKEMKSMTASILAMAGTVPQGPQKLAEGLYHVESAGFRGAQALSMVKAAAMGAALGNASLQNTTQAMIATMASQIKGVHGSADAMGQLNAIVGVGDMRMEQLAQAMATGVLPSAANAGLSLRDVGAALATVTDNATPANVVATRLRMTIALMASPSKAAAKQLASIGLTSTSLAHDMRQPNGLLVAVEDLKTHLRDAGLTAEQQFSVLSKVFGGGRSSAVIQTLIAETDRLKTKYKELEAINGPTRLAKSWSEFQASNSATFSELKSGAEGLAITIGNVVLPSLAKMATGASQAFASFTKSGGAANLGKEFVAGFDTLGSVISGLAPLVEGVAKALFDVGAAGVSVGQFFGLGFSGQIQAAAAAFLAFKAAAFIGPILMAAAAGISAVGVAAATAPSLAAFGADIVAMVGPLGLIAGAIGLAVGGFVALNSGLFSSSSAAEQNAAAMKRDEEAITGMHEATRKASETHLAAQRAALDHKKAIEQLHKVEGEVHTGKLKGPAAENALVESHINVAATSNQKVAATKEEAKAVESLTAANQKALTTAETSERLAAKELADVTKIQELRPAATAQERALQQKKMAEAQEAYNRAAGKTTQINAEIAVGQESLNRLNAGAANAQITAGNAQGVQALQAALSSAHAPSKIVTRFELEDQGAQAKLGELAARLDSVGKRQIVAKVLTTAPTATVAIAALTAVAYRVPQSRVIQILSNASSAQGKVRELTDAVHAVPGQKNVSISTNAATALGEIHSVGGALNELPAFKSIAVNVTKTFNTIENIAKNVTGHHASGRGQGPGETALVGEGGAPEYIIDSRTGKGQVVSRPTLMGLSPEDYVIPLEDRYRGRALGLFAQLAGSLGIPGYKVGRTPKKGGGKHAKATRPLPAHIDPLSIPLTDIETRASASKSDYEKAHKAVQGLSGKITTDERNVRFASPGSAKHPSSAPAKAREILNADRQKLQAARRHEAETHEWLVHGQKALHDAKAYQAKITRETDLANIAGNDMKLADGRDDQAGYDSAKGRRTSALAVLKGLLADARKHVHVGSEYFDKLTEQVQSTELEQQQIAGEELSPAKSKAAGEEERTGMTDAERDTFAGLQKNVALAALTSGLEDDKSAGQALTGFLEHVLGEAVGEPGARGGDETIKSLAEQVKSARSNVESLSGSGTNSNPDLQAQLTQANTRAETATREAQISNQALAVFGGPGDIGSGGANAYGAGGMVQNNYMLHPSDPAVLTAIGHAATAGIGFQGSQRTVRQQVGP